MLDLKFIRENPQKVQGALKAKNVDLSLEPILSLEEERRAVIQEVEVLKSERNKANEQIGTLKQEKKDASSAINAVKDISEKIKGLDQQASEVNGQLKTLLLQIPNIPDESTPIGDPSKNKFIKEWGKPEAKFVKTNLKDHVELSSSLGWVSSAIGAKLTGSGFLFFKGMGAKLERALINFMLDVHGKEHGYEEVSPPFVVNRETMTGTGQLPKLEDDMYQLKDEDFFLIPTAEVPVTNAHREEVLTEDELPKKYVAYTPCFRREAGSYGKDTKGLSRVHQFDKVELVKFTKPESSYEEHEKLLENAEKILQLLELPYRVVQLASGDLSFAAAKCYDLELWGPGSQTWFEVSSCSNFEDFQARRMNLKYRNKETNKLEFVHTLNASGLALPRTMIGILENYQKEDGSVEIPEVLKSYL